MNLFDCCTPRPDVLRGMVTESAFAADLAQMLRGEGPPEYRDAETFFANTHPTRGLRNLLQQVCLRLNGQGREAASIFRLDTQYGGGKTHALIALSHLLKGSLNREQTREFLEPELLPSTPARIAAFDGENSDPANGRAMGNILAFTPWGEIAYALAGEAGYESIRRSDENGVAPGAERMRELFGGEPTLILLDELSIFLRRAKPLGELARQLTPFLSNLFKAVEGAPNAALVFTLAIGKEGRASDAYAEENEFIARGMEEAQSVAARKATVLNPTEEGETLQVLRRRLFERIDPTGAEQIIEQYRRLWEVNRDHLPSPRFEHLEMFKQGYPLHPELITTLTNKLATLNNFQRIRGMLRLLVGAIADLWAHKPSDAYALHLHHLNLAIPSVRNEVVVRLEQNDYLPAIRADIDAAADDPVSLAEILDKQHHSGLPAYCRYVARTAFWHSLAFNEQLKGVATEELRYAIVSPGTDISFIDAAVTKFVAESAYLDDKPNAPLRFLTQPNINQLIRQQEKHIEDNTIRTQLRDRIREIFGGTQVFNSIFFPSSPAEVPDDGGESKPVLVVLSYEAVTIAAEDVKVPELVERLFKYRGNANEFRHNKNHLVFIAADHRTQDMYDKLKRRLALHMLYTSPNSLENHQKKKIEGMLRESAQEVAIAIQNCYRHLFYPSRNRVPDCNEDIAHCAIDLPSTSDKPGAGQKQIIEELRNLKKLRLADGEPDSPDYMCGKTPLRKGQITTAGLLAEYRKHTGLAILSGTDVLIKGIRQGVQEGKFVYKRGDLIFAKEHNEYQHPFIHIDENTFVYTADYAREYKIWPKPEAEVAKPNDPGAEETHPPTEGGGSSETSADSPVSLEKSVYADGVLREALIALWEQARKHQFDAVGQLILRLKELSDTNKLASEIQRIPDSTQTLRLEGGYTATDDSTLMLEFNGSGKEAGLVLNFLRDQGRAAAETDLNAIFTVTFSNGLPLDGTEPEQLTERLSRFVIGAAFVEATALKKD